MTDLSQVIHHLDFPITNEQEAQRLFHGRGHAFDGLHHVTIDWLPPVALITLFAPETEQAIKALANTLYSTLHNCQSVQLQHRYELSGPIDTLLGEEIHNLVIQENQLKYQLQLGKTRNTGLFLDMKNGREWVQNNCKEKQVLNLFSYTCGFSVAAIEGKAASVLNIDMSSPALSVGRENHRLNKHSLKNIKFEKLNIFNSFGRIKKRGPFDLLICDPPTFQKGSVDIARDYPKIMRRLNDFMSPNATLLLCLNAPELNREYLIDNMAKSAPNYRYIKELKPPSVYVESEAKGLKMLVFKSD